MATVDRLGRELDRLFEFKGILDTLTIPFRAPTVARWGLATAESLIRHHVTDPVLAGILAAQSGDHGLPPSIASAAVHASVTAHYFNGGFYPRGGAATLPGRSSGRCARPAATSRSAPPSIGSSSRDGAPSACASPTAPRSARATWSPTPIRT